MKKILLLFLFLSSIYSKAQQWTGGEYFLDKDPGIGKLGTIPFTASGSSDEITQNIEADISALNPGFHTIGIRLKGLSGGKSPKTVWSHTEYRTFFVSTPPILDTRTKPDIAEYFFDKDPGVGKGIPINGVVATDLTLDGNNIEIAVSNLSDGFHTLNIRVRNIGGKWSLSDSRAFYIPTPKTITTSEITEAYYFIDQDSGVTSIKNNKIDISKVTKEPDGSINLPMFDADISKTSLGFHTISIRVKNSIGNWSLFESRTFYVSKSLAERTTPKLISAEYFLDPDFKQTIVQPIVTKRFAPVDSISILDEEFDISGLSFGKHTIAVRVKDEKGNYSFVRDTSFTVTDCPVFPVADITFQANTKSSSNTGMCLPDTGLFIANVKGGNAATTYEWDFDGNGTIDNTTKGNVKFKYPRNGIFKATLTTSNGGKCFSKDSVMVTIESRPTTPPKVTYKDDTLFSDIKTNILWYDSKGKLIPNARGAFYSPLMEGIYYASRGNGKGCESDTSKGVLFIPLLPSAFTKDTIVRRTEGDPLNMSINLTGTPPWILYTRTNNVPNPPISITRSPYNWQVFAAGTYVLDSLVDGKNRKGRVSGNVTLILQPFIGATASTANKEYLITQIGDTAKVRISLRGTAPFTLYLSYENVERIINDIRDTFYIFKTFQQGNFKLTRIFDATGIAGRVNGEFTVKYKPIGAKINVAISGTDTLRGLQPAKVFLTLTGKAPWTVLWKIGNEPFPQPLRINKSPDTLLVFKDGVYTLISAIDAEGNEAAVSGEARIVKPAIPLYTGSVSGNGSLIESDTVYITFKYNGNIPWTLIYGNDFGFVDTVLVTRNEYVAKVYNRGVYRIIKIIDGKTNIPADIVTKGEARVVLDLITKEAFSPNGDGQNEVFEFKGLSLFQTNKLFIYNREGQSVFTAENYLNNWDGKDNNGKIIPDGVYYYTLKSINSGTIEPKELETFGYIEIRR
ncbi:MAG: hypothetical protein EAZ07_02635 [Cytophagales bacterium]|nr:MAG: hypothetical protein EAZ07_02635 [Cytophagales bacterium]